MARLVSRSELSRLAGVSPAAITKACKGTLAEARIGKRVDLDHFAVVGYLEKHSAGQTSGTDRGGGSGEKPTGDRPRSSMFDAVFGSGGKRGSSRKSAREQARPRKPSAPGSGLDVSWDEIEQFAHLSLDELVRRFGTAIAFRDWLTARKTIADIHEKELKNEKTMGALIDRELVKVHLLGLIDAGFRRLLADAPKTIARRLYALAKAGEPVEDAEKLVRETISSILRPVKTAAARTLRKA